jgi:hypothetical protein
VRAAGSGRFAVRANQTATCWSSPARIAAGQKWHAQAEAMGKGVTAALMQIAQV